MESNKGFLITAVTEDEQKSAEVLAMSIKLKNKNASVALSIPNLKNLKADEDVFDYIIEFPFNKDRNRIENLWQVYWITPYDDTIVVNPYSIVCENLNGTWDYLTEHHDLCFANHKLDFRGSIIWDADDSYYKEENVVHLHSDMFFFKKSNRVLEFFKLLDVYSQYWKIIYDKLLKPEHQSDEFDIDLVVSLAANILDLTNINPMNNTILSTINTDNITTSLKEEEKVKNIFTEYLNIWIRKDSNIKIHNFIVNGTLCYNSSLFLTEEIYDNYRKKYRETEFRKEMVD